MKSIGRAAVAQWTKRLTRTGQTRVRIREAHIFDITITTLWSPILQKVKQTTHIIRPVSAPKVETY